MQSVRQVTEWKASARFDDVLEVSMWTSRIGTTSFTLDAEIRRAGPERTRAELIATVETTYVHVDHVSFTKRAIEPAMRAALEAGAAGKQVDHAGYLAVIPCPSPQFLATGERVYGDDQTFGIQRSCGPWHPDLSLPQGEG